MAALSVTAAAWAADPAPRPQPPAPAARAAYTAAAALQNRGAWDLAASAWEALLRDHPRDVLAPRARHYLGVCRLEEGRFEDAAREFRAAIEAAAAAPGGDAETLALARWELARGTFAAAQRSADAGAFGGAVGELRAFLAAAPGGEAGQERVAEARFLLAEALWQSGDREAALGEWDRYTRDHAGSPRLPDVLYALGVARAEAGDAAGAEATLARFQDRFPDHALAAEVAIRRADLALAAGKPVEAARLVVELAKDGQGPRAADALDRLGAALYRQERFAASANAYDRLAALRGADAAADDARLSAAAAWAAAGKEAEARTRLEQVCQGDPSRPTVAEACERLARIMLASGDPAGALASVERGLSASPPAATGSRLELGRA
ncbi:MAG: tetratricopeptide repeat protein [Planctomycetaceae bacterium]